MPPFHGLLSAAAAAALAVTACQTKSSGQPAPSASASASAIRVIPPPRLPDPPEVRLCRVIAVRPSPGTPADASVASQPSVGTAFEGSTWVDIERNTEVVLRHSSTTRELMLRGPGRFLPCFLGSETVLVATGTVTVTAGAGARAGAEVILATPLGAIHFADAGIELRVTERELAVEMVTGAAALFPAKPPKDPGDAGTPELVLGSKGKKKLSGAPNVEELVARCVEASRVLGAPPPALPATLPSARALRGQWSVEQLKARQVARLACAIARAAAGRVDGPERSRLWDQITAVDRVWQAAP